MMKVEGYPDLRKSNGAVINTNSLEYRTALKRNQNKQRMDELEAKVNSLDEKLNLILGALNVSARNDPK